MKFPKFISYFFHPINFPIIGTILYFLLLPEYIFKAQEHLILIVTIVGTYVFPLFILVLLKQFEMIKSYHMETIEERKFPTVLFIGISLILGNWLLKTNVVNVLSLFYFGFTLALTCSYLALHLKLKISLHTGAVGGLIGFLICFSYHYKINVVLFLSLFFLISGLIAYSRIRLQAHKVNEIVIGFILGIFSQIIMYTAYYII